MDLFEHPQLYDTLRAPPPAALAAVQHVLAREFPQGVRSLMDPACGPGNWLEAVATPAMHVAGNDLSARMVRFAHERLAGRGAELVEGDMRALAFGTGPFDVALEASGTASMLLDLADFEHFLRSLAAHVRPGGACLLALFFPDVGMDGQRPRLLHQDGPLPVPGGGTASIRYESMAWDPERRVEHVRRTTTTDGVPGAPERLVDEFDLRIWTRAAVLAALAAAPGFEWTSTWPLDPSDPQAEGDEEPIGEQLLVLRRR